MAEEEISKWEDWFNELAAIHTEKDFFVLLKFESGIPKLIATASDINALPIILSSQPAPNYIG